MPAFYNYQMKNVGDYIGVVGLGFVASPDSFSHLEVASVDGYSPLFNVIDLTEPDGEVKNNYKGGIQSIDKGFTASPILIPIPQELPVGYEIGFVESGVITIAGVWFDGLREVVEKTGTPPFEKTVIKPPREMILEDLRTQKHYVHSDYTGAPYIFFLSNRAYPVFITGFSTNIVGGQGGIISFRLGLAICQITGHYPTK